MKDYIKKPLNNITRLLTNERISYKLHLYWVVLSVLLMGVFGVFPLIKEIHNKYQIAKQMVKINKDLSAKFNELYNTSEKISLVEKDIVYLNNYLPEDFDLQNYMTDFVATSGKAGYYVGSFTPQKNDYSEVEIAVSLFGNGDLVKLTENLENMNRVSEIQNVTFEETGEDDILRLSIKTYIIEKQ